MEDSTPSPHRRIAVVGCGVAGLTAALLLARQGNAVTLFEQSPRVGPVGAGILLQPSGELVLAAMSLLDAVTARSTRIDRLVARTHRGHRLIDLPYAAAGAGLHAFGLHRGDLFAVLHERVCAAGVSIALNCKVNRAVERTDCIELFDASGGSCGSYDLLLAADGARSTLRGSSVLPASVYHYPHGALWALGSSTAVTDHLLQATRGTRELCGLLPMGEGRCSLFWSVDHADKQSLLHAGFDAWKRQVLDLVPEADELLSGLRSFEQVRFTDYYHVRMPAWHTPRCLFLGDAAHAMSPHLGQGINLALLDGFTIAQTLLGSVSVTDAFERYERLRRAHVGFYSIVTYLLSPFFQSRGWIKGWMRDLFLPHLHRVPFIGPQMLMTMTGLKRSAAGGMLTLPQIAAASV